MTTLRFFHKWTVTITRMSLICQPYAIYMYSHSHVTHMSLVCSRMSPYVTHMYLYAICMSLVCGFTMNYKVLVYHWYVTRMYLYIIRMSLMCHSYVICMYLYVTHFSFVCSLILPVSYSSVLLFYVAYSSFICHSHVVLP